MMLVEAVEGTPISKECALYVQVQAGAPDDSKHLGMVKKVLNIVPMNDEVYYNVGTSRPELLSNERKIYVLIGEGGALVAAEDGDAKLSAAEDITMNGAVSIVASAIASSAAADAQAEPPKMPPTRKKKGQLYKHSSRKKSDDEKDEDYVDEPSAEEKDDATEDSTTFVFESLWRVTKDHQVGRVKLKKGEFVTYQSACHNKSKNFIYGLPVSSLVNIKRYDANLGRGASRTFLASKEYLTSASVGEAAKKKGEAASKSKSQTEDEETEDAKLSKSEYDKKRREAMKAGTWTPPSKQPKALKPDLPPEDYDEDNYEAAAFDPDDMDIVKEEEMNEVSATKRGGGGKLSEPPKKKQAVTKAPSSMSSVTATPQEMKPSAVVVTNTKDSKTAPVASAVTDTTVKNAGAPAAAAKDDEVAAALQLKPTAAVVTAKDSTIAPVAAVADAKDQVPVTPGEFPSEHYAAGWKVVPEGTQSLCGNYTAKETTYISSRGTVQTRQPQDWQVGQEREYLREQERLREDAARTETSRQGNTLDLEREYREYRREQERLREEAARAEASRQGNTSTQGMMEGLSSLYSSAKAKGSEWFGSAKAKVSAQLSLTPKEDPPGRRLYE